jgi:hypothetical protein
MMTQVVTPSKLRPAFTLYQRKSMKAMKAWFKPSNRFHQTTAEYEVAMARSRISWASKSSPTGKNYTVGEREDMAIIENAEQHFMIATDGSPGQSSACKCATIKNPG